MDDKRVKNNEYQPSLSYGRSKKYTYIYIHTNAKESGDDW